MCVCVCVCAQAAASAMYLSFSQREGKLLLTAAGAVCWPAVASGWFHREEKDHPTGCVKGKVCCCFCTLSLLTHNVLEHYYGEWCSHKSRSLLLMSLQAETTEA